MKKTLFFIAVALLASACNQQTKQNSVTTNVASSNKAPDSVYYVGTIPEADGPGIVYKIALANDATNGFLLTATYLEAEDGQNKTFRNVGTMDIVKQTINDQEVTFYRFPAADSVDTEIFKVIDDNTLRKVNSDFEEAATAGLNYDLKKL